jgi:thimet oligopeptidase
MPPKRFNYSCCSARSTILENKLNCPFTLVTLNTIPGFIAEFLIAPGGYMTSNKLNRIIFLALSCIISACTSTQVISTDKAGSAPLISVKAQAYERQCNESLNKVTLLLNKQEQIQPPFSIDSVLVPLNNLQISLSNGARLASTYKSVHPDPDLRKVATDCLVKFSDIGTQLSLSRPIYESLSQVDVSSAADDTLRFHELTMRGFQLSGVDKNEETRKKIRALNDEITKIGQIWDKNILEDVRYIEVTLDDLKGLPQDYLDAHPPGDNGLIKISTRYPDIYPIYTFAESDELRQRLRQQERSRAYPQNKSVLNTLLEKRTELANILGFSNFADLVTADKMIGNADNAQEFIERVSTLAIPAKQADIKQLLARLQQIDKNATEVNRWQVAYLQELIKKEQYKLDAAEVRQYFSYGKVRDGIFQLVSELFEVEIRAWETEAWHPSVESYEMLQDGKVFAQFHLDMHPREGKYQHAAAFGTRAGITDRQLPLTTLVCNFPGENNPDALMEFGQVTTFLHEFGHLIHGLFAGDHRWESLSGIATEWDFVEAPSQMLEEWVYDLETLQAFATNAQNETIPAELVEKLNQARWFGKGLNTGIQMYYAALSLNYHSSDPSTFELFPKMLELEKRYSPLPHQEGTYFFTNLGHLNGYSAIYYTYMWSKVIAADLLTEFKKQGMHDTDTARHYRNNILSQGGSKPAARLVEDFLGRPYNFEAFANDLKKGLSPK